MRKFFGIVIISITFFACLFAAIFLAENVSPATNTRANSRIVTANQYNLLVLVVDKLDKTVPDLISAWSVILYFGNEQGLIIIPLTLPDSGNFNALNEQFRMDKAKHISNTATQFFQKTFEMKWDGTVLIDYEGLTDLLNWVSFSQHNYSVEELQEIIYMTDRVQSFLPKLCTAIMSNKPSDPGLLPMETLAPDHISSAISFENLRDIWLQFDPEKLILCESYLLP